MTGAFNSVVRLRRSMSRRRRRQRRVDLGSRLQDPVFAATTSPWRGYERNAGYAVVNQPLSSGHMLALRVFPATDFGGYVSVWHRDPDGAWAQYVDRAPVEAGCPRVWGPALEHAANASITVDWVAPDRLHVGMVEPSLEWDMTIQDSLLLRLLNAVNGRLPLATWRPRPLVAARERLASRLGLGPVSMSGTVPTGERLTAAVRTMHWIGGSRARLAGEDLGTAVVLAESPTIDGWRLPRRGVFAEAEAHVTTPDRHDYERLRRATVGQHEA